jgi:O-antigen/teichoic acid export membrane protein
MSAKRFIAFARSRDFMSSAKIEFEEERLRDSCDDTPETLTAEMETAIRSVVRSVGVNTFYQIGSQIAPAIAAVVAIPILLRRLGPEAYGIVTLFSTLLIYFTMLDLGLGRAATRFIAQSFEAGRQEDVRRYFWSSMFLLIGAGIVVSVGSVFFVPTLVSNYLKISPEYSRAATQSFYLIAMVVPLVTLTAGLRGFLEAVGRFPFLSMVTACCGVALYFLPVVAVVAGGSLRSVAASYVAVRLAMGLAFAFGCFRLKERPSLRPAFDSGAMKKMVSFGGWLSISNVIGTAMVYGDRFLLGACVGMVAVASYSMPLDVIGRMQILITSFCAVLFPLLSRMDGSGSAHFQTVYRSAAAIALSLITPLTVSLVLLSPILMKFWLRARNTPDAVFAAQVFLAGSVVQAMGAISFTALHARGRSDLAAWVHMAEFPIYCAAFYWAASCYGVRGAALVWLGRMVVDFVCMVLLLRLQNKDTGGGVIASELAAALTCIGVLAIIALPRFSAFITAAAICILTWVWTWRALLDSSMRGQLVRATGSMGKMFSGMTGIGRDSE